MSASLQMETEHWKNNGRFAGSSVGTDPSVIEMERFFRNADQSNIVAPLREARAAQAKEQRPKRRLEEKRRAALALQERWNGWLEEREQVRNDIKRGKECLEQVQRDQALARAGLEQWPEYERVCGKNPLFQYTETLVINERIEQFLPAWLKRREERLAAILQEMEVCARQNGLEHLL
jgi:hypothetical protein